MRPLRFFLFVGTYVYFAANANNVRCFLFVQFCFDYDHVVISSVQLVSIPQSFAVYQLIFHHKSQVFNFPLRLLACCR